jgi:restriction system protein
MPVPGYQEFMRAILEVVSGGQDRNVRDVYAQVADRLALTEADRQELIPSGTQRLLDNRVGWAKTYLLKAGLLEVDLTHPAIAGAQAAGTRTMPAVQYRLFHRSAQATVSDLIRRAPTRPTPQWRSGGGQ